LVEWRCMERSKRGCVCMGTPTSWGKSAAASAAATHNKRQQATCGVNIYKLQHCNFCNNGVMRNAGIHCLLPRAGARDPNCVRQGPHAGPSQQQPIARGKKCRPVISDCRNAHATQTQPHNAALITSHQHQGPFPQIGVYAGCPSD
jgi:hypothetical protein